MIVEVADHPVVLFCLLVVCLPEAVAMLPLEPTLTPNPPRRLDRIVQSSLDEDAVDRSMADWCDPLNLVGPQVSLDLVRSPMFTPSRF